jgi:hypothetical protein
VAAEARRVFSTASTDEKSHSEIFSHCRVCWWSLWVACRAFKIIYGKLPQIFFSDAHNLTQLKHQGLYSGPATSLGNFPDEPYVEINDLPKIEEPKKQSPKLYLKKPVLVRM